MCGMVSWVEIEKMTEDLATRVVSSGYMPNYVVAVARGGFVPARLLAGLLGVARLGSIGISHQSTERNNATVYGRTVPIGAGDRVLLVEDIVESGRSLAEGRRLLYGAADEVRTICYYRWPDAVIEPDYFLAVRSDLPNFPWESVTLPATRPHRRGRIR